MGMGMDGMEWEVGGEMMIRGEDGDGKGGDSVCVLGKRVWDGRRD